MAEAPPLSPERRRTIRHPVRHDCVVEADTGSVWVGQLCNLFTAGAEFLSPFPIPKGRSVKLRSMTPGPRISLKGRLVYSHRDGQSWRMGCTLDRQLTEEELQQWL